MPVSQNHKHLLCLGLGYSARYAAAALAARGWTVTGTARSEEGAARIRALGYEAIRYDGGEHAPSPELADAISNASHILHSIAPDLAPRTPAPADAPLDADAPHEADAPLEESPDCIIRDYLTPLKNAHKLHWFGYLSTVGVYGNWDGEWVDEQSEIRPKSARSLARARAEHDWLALAAQADIPVHIFRLAGIYGPGRNGLLKLQQGTARRINKPGQVFNRIHVEDIAQSLSLSLSKPNPGAIYNVCDDFPCPPQDVVAYGAELLGIDPPPLIAFEDADLSPMGRSFYGENKRVRNERLKQELGFNFAYPTFREGLRCLVDTLPAKK